MKLFYCLIALLLLSPSVIFADEKVVNNYHPQFSADGKTVYFLSDRSGKEKVYYLDLATRLITETSDFPFGIEGNYSVHNGKLIIDGRKLDLPLDVKEVCGENTKYIYFTAAREGRYEVDIYQTDRYGIDCSQLFWINGTEKNLSVYQNFIVFDTDRFGGQELCLFDTETEDCFRLTIGSENNVSALYINEQRRIKNYRNLMKIKSTVEDISNGTIYKNKY